MEMNQNYQQMAACIDEWAFDATSILNGSAKLFQEHYRIDDVSKVLLQPSENDALVQEILRTIFSGFSALLQRMVADHLSGGEFDVDLAKHPEKRKETASVQKTNTVSERDFAQLDRLLREKPNATTMSLEAMVMFSNNKTAKWIKTKSAQEREDLFKLAREKGPKFRKIFKARRLEMLEEKAKQMREKQATAARKRVKERKEKEDLTQAIISMGLWQTTDQIEAGLSKLRSKTSKLKALKTQLDFRKKVLQQTHPNKLVFQLSHMGHQYTVDEMKQNLLQLLPHGKQFSHSHISCPSDITGMRIQHRWIVEGESEWFTGVILGRVAVDSSSSWYNILYDGEESIVTLDVKEDIEAGDIVFLG